MWMTLRPRCRSTATGGSASLAAPDAAHGSRTAPLRPSTIATTDRMLRPHVVSSVVLSAASFCTVARGMPTHGTCAARSAESFSS